MAKSANGWPVITDKAKTRIIHVPGSDVAFRVADDDDVAAILTAVAWWVDTHVEDLDTRKGVKGYDVPDDWGWAVRLIRGATRTISNHASGTAIDVNAVRHPMTVRRTWRPDQIRAVDGFLARLGGSSVVRWGEHYLSRTDGMHFEINTTDRAALRHAAAVARQVLTPAPTPTPAKPASPSEDDMPTIRELLDADLPLGDGEADTLATVDPRKGRRMTIRGAWFRAALSSWAAERGIRVVDEKVAAVDEKVDKLTAAVATLTARLEAALQQRPGA